MRPGRIIFAVLLLGALIWGYTRSMAPIVKYDPAVALPNRPAGAVTIDWQPRYYIAYTLDDQLYAEAAHAQAYVKIQGVYRSPRDGSLEVAVFERPLEAGETGSADAVIIKLPTDKWPDEIVFRDVTGNLLARSKVETVVWPPQLPSDLPGVQPGG